MTDLKPCPFCGGKARHGQRLTQGYDIVNLVVCSEPGCRADVGFISAFREKMSAYKVWNTRAATPERKALRELVCKWESLEGRLLILKEESFLLQSFNEEMEKAKEVLGDE